MKAPRVNSKQSILGQPDFGGRLDELSETMFRAINVGGHRKGIRLEKIFWDVLESIAAAEGMRLGQLVAAVHATLQPSDNLTARLRVFATEQLRLNAART